MKCPNCGYEHDGYAINGTHGEHGDFFWTKKRAIRSETVGCTYTREERDVYGCPKCNMMFMEA